MDNQDNEKEEAWIDDGTEESLAKGSEIVRYHTIAAIEVIEGKVLTTEQISQLIENKIEDDGETSTMTVIYKGHDILQLMMREIADRKCMCLLTRFF